MFRGKLQCESLDNGLAFGGLANAALINTCYNAGEYYCHTSKNVIGIISNTEERKRNGGKRIMHQLGVIRLADLLHYKERNSYLWSASQRTSAAVRLREIVFMSSAPFEGDTHQERWPQRSRTSAYGKEVHCQVGDVWHRCRQAIWIDDTAVGLHTYVHKNTHTQTQRRQDK